MGCLTDNLLKVLDQYGLLDPLTEDQIICLSEDLYDVIQEETR